MDTGFDKNMVKISHFLSGLFPIRARYAMEKSDLSVNFSPATSKLILVHNHFTDFGPSFGVLQGDTLDLNLEPALQLTTNSLCLTSL
jgi:hypothetical protein